MKKLLVLVMVLAIVGWSIPVESLTRTNNARLQATKSQSTGAPL